MKPKNAKDKLFNANSRVSELEYQALRGHNGNNPIIVQNDLIRARQEASAAEREYRKSQKEK